MMYIISLIFLSLSLSYILNKIILNRINKSLPICEPLRKFMHHLDMDDTVVKVKM